MQMLKDFFLMLSDFIVKNPLIWICCLASFVLSSVFIPIIIKLCKKHGWYDSVNARKVHKGNIPRLGSMGFVPAFTIMMAVYVLIVRDSSKTMIPFVIAGFVIFVFGIIDDFLDLRAIVKLFIQIIAALIVLIGGFRFKQFYIWTIPASLGYLITFCWIIGIINAYNLIDGVDGLCGGLSAITLLALGIIYSRSVTDTAAACFILIAAICGFLLYNKPKAKIFMGDGGSQFLGFMIAALPLYQTTDTFETNKFFIVINLVSIPLIDCIAAIWRRIRDHRGIMSPDRSHLHHKLMNMGCSVGQILLILLGLQSVICIMCGIAMALKGTAALVLLICTFAGVNVFFCAIHYANRAVIQKQKVLEEK